MNPLGVLNHSGLLVTLIAGVLTVAGRAVQAGADIEPFHAACAETADAARAAGTMTVTGVDDWLFSAGELRHLGAGIFWGDRAAAVSRAHREQDADPLPAILDFKRQLDALGIELIMMPVPPKAIIYPDKTGLVAPTDDVPARLDSVHQRFYGLLRDAGIQVLDLTDVFLKNRFSEDGSLYCRHDSHWSGLACNLAAAQLAALIKTRDGIAGIERIPFVQRTVTREISGDLWKAMEETGQPARETVTLREITTPDGRRVAPDRNSPVILLGDSHTLVFQAGDVDMHATGAGLADQLAYELGLAVDLIGVRGSGATPARINLLRRGLAAADYFDNKQLIIWCFAAREFTETQGWRLVPVKPRTPEP